MKYRAVWVADNGEIIKGVLTNIDTAREEVTFKKALGIFAWLEDAEGVNPTKTRA